MDSAPYITVLRTINGKYFAVRVAWIAWLDSYQVTDSKPMHSDEWDAKMDAYLWASELRIEYRE